MTRKAWVGVVFLSLLTASIYASCGARLFHSLENRPSWVSTKSGLERGVMGSVAFMKTPMALHADVLNLGAWHGFQEIFWREPLSVAEVRFRLRLPEEQSYVSFLYNRSTDSSSELRLSRNPRYPSQWSRIGPDRERMESQSLDGVEFDAEWHEARLDFRSDGVTLSVDGRTWFQRDELLNPVQEIGFRGGYSSSYIDDVEVVDERGRVVASDDFEVRTAIVPIAVGTLLLVGLGGAVGWRRSRALPLADRPRTAFQTALLLYLVLLLVALPFAWVERSFLSGRHGYSALHFQVWKWIARPGRPLTSYLNTVPLLRETWANSEPEGAERILLVGTSQTWGSGASRWEGDLAHRLAANLEESLGPRRFEVINGGISGRRSDFILPYYENEWIEWGADTAVINFGNNDTDPQIFEETLEEFVRLNRDRGIQTVLVLEANYPEVQSDQLIQNHAILRAVADRHDLPVVDLHGALLEAAGDGLLWWDFVHLTDYGQRRAANILGDALVPLLSEPQAP